MIGPAVVASAVIFVLAMGWMLVDRWFRSSMKDLPEGCELPRTECGHCMMADECSLHDEESDGEG